MKNKCFLILLFFLLISCNFLFVSWAYLTTPLNTTQIIFVQPRWSFKRLIIELDRMKIVTLPIFLEVWGRVYGLAGKIKPGEYLITPDLTPVALLKKLSSGKGVIYHKVIIPEGATIKQIAEIFAQYGLINRTKFIRLAYNRHFAHSLGIDAPSLEGYLFPATYFLPKGLSEDIIIKMMLTKFNHIYQKYSNKAKKMGFSRHEIVTLASIIEKETAVKTEKPLIASVFLNRLRRKMPLQADPTVIYALPHFNGNLTKKDLKYVSPYNTYIIKGLPPTPICNPGEESIRAVVEAPDTPYLYFVSRGNGTHYFSKNLKEHNRAVLKYQRKRH